MVGLYDLDVFYYNRKFRNVVGYNRRARRLLLLLLVRAVGLGGGGRFGVCRRAEDCVKTRGRGLRVGRLRNRRRAFL